MLNELSEIYTPNIRRATITDRIESIYLSALRVTLLTVATILLVGAVIWAVASVTKIIKSPTSVAEKSSIVTSSEVVNQVSQSSEDKTEKAGEISDLHEKTLYYDNFVKRYFSLFHLKYQPYSRSDDKQLTTGEFDDLTINSSTRLDLIRKGQLDFVSDKKDLETFLPVVSEASSSPVTNDRLKKYLSATKRPVATQVLRFRTESRRGWNAFSQSCASWYESPIGCAVTRRVEVPYNEPVTVMRYPEGLASPSEILKTYQDKYFAMLAERRRVNSEEVTSERQEIITGQAAGWSGLSRSIMVLGGFLLLMFFFLLVAIERHLRLRSTSLE